MPPTMAPTFVELRSSAAPTAAELALAKLVELAAVLELELDAVELDELEELGTAMAWMTGTAVTLDDQRQANSAA